MLSLLCRVRDNALPDPMTSQDDPTSYHYKLVRQMKKSILLISFNVAYSKNFLETKLTDLKQTSYN